MLSFLGTNVAEAATNEGLSIHMGPSVLGHFFGFPITNTLLVSWIAMAILIGITLVVRMNLSLVPGKLQSVVESVIGFAYSYVHDVLESESLTRRFFPIIMTIFLFILTVNWFSLLPGIEGILFTPESSGHGAAVALFHSATADLNATLAIAIAALITIEFAGIATLGFFKYGAKFINFSSPLKFAVGVIELISEISRLISFSFRLFGNIFAGKTLLLVAATFVPLILPVPLIGFEMFVGLIQAFVFAMLTLFFIKAATEAH